MTPYNTLLHSPSASVSLECTSSPDGVCRSVLYGVMKIQKSVAIVRKCKMGGCEHHYLAMTWAAPIHSKIGWNKAPQRGKWVVCSSQFACDPAQKKHLLLKKWIGCMRIYKLRLKNGFSSMIEKWPSGMPRAVFFEYKKMIVLPFPSGVPSIAPIIMRFQRINMMLVCLFIGLISPLLPTLL